VDDVIEHLSSEFTQGRMIIGQELPVSEHANALHTLAAEGRMGRYLIGLQVADVLHETPSSFWSVAVESPDQPRVMYIWLIYPMVDVQISEARLEQAIVEQLHKYVFVAMGKFPTFDTFLGIAMPNAKATRTSRAYCLAQRNDWTQEMQLESEKLSARENIFDHIETTVAVISAAI